MAYDRGLSTYHHFTGISISAGFSKNIRGPRGKRGIVRRIYGSVTTTTAFSTLAPVATVTTTVAPVPNRKGGTVYPASTVIFSAALVATTAPAGYDFESRQSIAGGPGNIIGDENGLAFMSKEDADLVLALSAATGAPSGVVDVSFQIDWV